LNEDVRFSGVFIKILYRNIIKCPKPIHVRSKFKIAPLVFGPQEYQGTELILENMTMYLCGPLVLIVEFGLLLFCIWQSVKQKPIDMLCRIIGSVDRDMIFSKWEELFPFKFEKFLHTYFYIELEEIPVCL
jgi:hypothetical protein